VSRESAASGLGKVVVGGAVGFGLYMLVTGLGFGGWGRGGRGDSGEDTGTSAPLPPARPRDPQRLNFLLSTKGLEERDADWKIPSVPKIYSVEDAIARVKDGGRSDVTLRISGSTIQGVVDATLAALKRAGIVVWKMTGASPPARVAGNVRGEYGRGRRTA